MKNSQKSFSGFGNAVNNKFSGNTARGGVVDQLDFETGRMIVVINLAADRRVGTRPGDGLRKRGRTEAFAGSQEINGFQNISFAGTIGAEDKIGLMGEFKTPG